MLKRLIVFVFFAFVLSMYVRAEVIKQKVGNFNLGGDVRGFGILAKYDQPPNQIIVQRKTIKPDNEPFVPVCTIKVFSPDGNNQICKVITDQANGAKDYVIPIQVKQKGIWRFSISGGRHKDVFTIKFPKTKYWGIRGEMAMALSNTIPNKMYLYVPVSAEKLFMESFGRGKNVPRMSYEGKLIGKCSCSPRQLTTVENPPRGKIVTVDLQNCKEKAIAFDGVPGLLCPTKEAASELKGGTVKAGGLLTAGPLQARARNLMLKINPADLKVDLKFAKDVSDDLSNPILEGLLYGKYAPISSLKSALSKQDLNPNSPFYGAFPVSGGKKQSSWNNFQYRLLSPFDASGLASIYVLKTKLNPGYGNKAIFERTILSALYHIASLQGDDIMRDNSFQRTSYPMTYVFFSFDGALAKPLYLLKDKLSAEEREVWTQGVMAVGDKVVNYKAYQSNQWAHLISGIFYAYLATKEPRFLKYTEDLLSAFADNVYGPSSKYGQHPAGFYLEGYGPDGNYDHLSSYVMVNIYYKYKALKNANPRLVAKLYRMIEKNLYFKSFYWLPQPNGDLICPTAFDCRTTGMIGMPGYPGDFMAKAEFSLANRRYKMSKQLGSSAFPASVFPFVANSNQWAMTLLKEMLPKKDLAFKMPNVMGGWTVEVYDAYKLPVKVEDIQLPCEQKNKVWELPGQIAWEKGGIYGIVFYDVIGAGKKHKLGGILGGGPTVLWTEKNGMIICSMKNKHYNQIKNENDLTFSCIYGTDKSGKLFYSGTERSQLEWQEKDKKFSITSNLRDVPAVVCWSYDIGNDKTTITVEIKSDHITDAWINLPIYIAPKATTIGLENGIFVVNSFGHKVEFFFPKKSNATLSENLASSAYTIRALRIKIPCNRKIDIRVRTDVASEKN